MNGIRPQRWAWMSERLIICLFQNHSLHCFWKYKRRCYLEQKSSSCGEIIQRMEFVWPGIEGKKLHPRWHGRSQVAIVSRHSKYLQLRPILWCLCVSPWHALEITDIHCRDGQLDDMFIKSYLQLQRFLKRRHGNWSWHASNGSLKTSDELEPGLQMLPLKLTQVQNVPPSFGRSFRATESWKTFWIWGFVTILQLPPEIHWDSTCT